MIAYDPSRTALYSPERRESVFRRDRTYSRVQLAVEAARLAYYRAENSTSERARLSEALSRVGFSDLELFVDATTGCAGFAAHRHSDGSSILAFRGTQPDNIKAITTNSRASTVPWPESSGRVHPEFAEATRALIPQICEWAKKAKPDPDNIIMTGHGLGAALATLVSSVWCPRLVVTLGSPRVGDADFVASLHMRTFQRIVNCCDSVTDVPPPAGYLHVGLRTYVNRHDEIIDTPGGPEVRKDRLLAHAQYTLQDAWKWGNVLVRSLADHAPINYVRALFT